MKKQFRKLSKLPWSKICLISLVAIFFSFSIILTYDSGHYLSYVSIFEGNSPASNWDIVRGPVFPGIIQLSNLLFGKTSTGILICTFLFYLSFVVICCILSKKISKNYQHHKLINALVLIYLILNPLIFGYFHVLLTEFVAITVTMLNILLAYKWIFVDLKNKKSLVLYSLYFIFTTIFCWHLKQPYIIIAIAPAIIACIISIVENHQKFNLLYRLGTIIFSLGFLVLSILSWNIILDSMHVDKNTGRDSSSSLSKQLITTYQITDESDNHFSAFITEFTKNPGKIIGTYFNNYCSLISLCKVSSTNSVDYISTGELDLLETYENTAIGYATFNRNKNLFQMSDEMQYRASSYATDVSRNIFRPFFKVLSYPTNIIYKLVLLLLIPVTIFLIVIKFKTKDKKHQHLFYLSIILLSTASFHLIFSAVALVIDRYAIEAFIPACLGIFGTITYAKLTLKNKPTLKSKHKRANA